MDSLHDKKWMKLIADYERHSLRIEKATQVKLSESHAEKTKRIALLEGDI